MKLKTDEEMGFAVKAVMGFNTSSFCMTLKII